MLTLLVIPFVYAECAGEGEYVNIFYKPGYRCCSGLMIFDTMPEAMDSAMMCYNPDKGQVTLSHQKL